MGAPKGNKFWEARTKHGRDKIFSTPEILWAAAVEYFSWCEDNPLQEEKLFQVGGKIITGKANLMRAMTLEGLCLFLGVSRTTYYEYKDNEGYKDFSDIIKDIESVIRNQKFAGAAAGLLNANIIARDLGLKERTDHSSEDGTMTPKGFNDFYDDDKEAES